MLPQLVCLAHIRNIYFLFCCVEVSCVVLCCIALHCVAIHCVVSVVLHCVAICCIVLRLRSAAIHCVVSAVLGCIAFDPLCCVADEFSISSIPTTLTLYK